ncbi:MAG: hypothetical protein KKB50_14755 [Planctomycetes bacterium]|nr:hypothetical protein [Planctomycetota bacterium]
MREIRDLIGSERELDDVSRALKHEVDSLRPPVVGALHVVCSDESEQECMEAFQRWFVQDMLPSLKLGSRAPFRSTNLGARYEWGSIRVAEEHFATPETRDRFKVVVVKLNGHVAVRDEPGGPCYGYLERYQTKSACCGALQALLSGEHSPAIADLNDAFGCGNLDRLALLLNTDRVPPDQRALLAAIVSVRLQARRAMLDIQDYQASAPTLFLVLPCVTFNRPGRDTELVCGLYTADHRSEQRTEEYCGLGDDPAKYELHYEAERLRVADDQSRLQRPARNHRNLVLEEWRARHQPEQRDDARLTKLRAEVAAKRHLDNAYVREMLTTLLWVAADLVPVSAAIMLFAKGITGIHHVHRVHRLARNAAGQEEARQILAEVRGKVDQLSPEQARRVIESLLERNPA